MVNCSDRSCFDYIYSQTLDRGYKIYGMEKYHQLISERMRQRIGRAIFGRTDITPVEYTPEPAAPISTRAETSAWRALQGDFEAPLPEGQRTEEWSKPDYKAK